MSDRIRIKRNENLYQKHRIKSDANHFIKFCFVKNTLFNFRTYLLGIGTTFTKIKKYSKQTNLLPNKKSRFRLDHPNSPHQLSGSVTRNQKQGSNFISSENLKPFLSQTSLLHLMIGFCFLLLLMCKIIILRK